MAELGFRTVDEMIGRVRPARRARRRSTTGRPQGLDLSRDPLPARRAGRRRAALACATQDHGLDEGARPATLIAAAAEALERGEPVELDLPIRNVNRTVGTMLGSEITRRYGAAGLPDDTIRVHFTGSAGQSFGAFLPRGITLIARGRRQRLRRARGSPAARSSSTRRRQSTFVPEENIIIGNVALYGATGGEAFFRGLAGERFAVRNSGAHAVVEGVGDHGCEYMTGGRGRRARPHRAQLRRRHERRHRLRARRGPATFATRCNLEMVDLEPLERSRGHRSSCRDLIRHARAVHRQRPSRARHPRELGRECRPSSSR